METFVYNIIPLPLLRGMVFLNVLSFYFIGCIVVILLPYFLVSTLLFLVGFGILESIMLLLFSPILLLVFQARLKRFLKAEIALIEQVGEADALWYPNDSSEGLLGKRIVSIGVDYLSPILSIYFLSFFKIKDEGFGDDLDMQSLMSIAWSRMVGILAKIFLTQFDPTFALVFVYLCKLSWVSSVGFRFTTRFLKACLLLLCFVLFSSPEMFLLFLKLCFSVVNLLGSKQLYVWIKWRITHFLVALTVLYLDSVYTSRKFTPVVRQQFGIPQGKPFSSIFKIAMMRATIFLNDLSLPHYLRGMAGYSRLDVEESMKIMSDLGWPINVNIKNEPSDFALNSKFKEWVLCGTDWEQGIHNLKTYTDHLLDSLRVGALKYRRTEEYASIENELEATSRYFRSPRFDYPDLELDDVWYILRTTFENSRLTPFSWIIHKWEKKYGLGAFMRKPGSKAKHKRRDFIRSIGFGKFKRLWRDTFEWANLITPVAAVSVKGEALPPKKWLDDKVRTVIGSPLVHYIATTVWNYEPNHRFSWEKTPTKVGMPINGYWMADLYERHARCQHHFAGDMTAFDSTVTGKVIDLIKAVRKKGFEHHKDYQRIAALIDVGYDQIEHQLLNITSTGDIYRKGVGEATGHSSTTADNSMALLILYLLAWKQLTGLSAKEFTFYNELSDYGDDHILSMLATKPSSWSFKNIQKCMKRWGVTNNLEAEGKLSDIPFLSKFSRKVTSSDKALFKEVGVPCPPRVVYHDKQKLVGKMTANVLNKDPRYRAKRLLSYLSLTAHHPDLYNGIVRVLTRSTTMKRAMKEMKVKVPTYNKVLAQWYDPKAHIPEDKISQELEEIHQEHDQLCYHYGQVTLLDSLLGSLSLLPDIVNPTIFNYGYERYLQTQVRNYLFWAFDFMCLTNQVTSVGSAYACISKSPYRVIITDLQSLKATGLHPGSYLLRHWLYMFYYRTFSHYQTPWIVGIQSKIAQIQFIFNGVLFPDFGLIEFRILDILVICLLNLVPLSPWFSILSEISFPRLDILWNLFTGQLLALFWQSVPPNFKESTHLLRHLSPSTSPLLVSSPTGTGKSTSFIQHVLLTIGPSYNKIVVVLPRSVLVKTIVPYVQSSFNMDATGWTSGFDFNKRAKVWYVTPQEFLLHLKLCADPHNLVILDECHIVEPFYKIISSFLASQNSELNSIFLTATPSEDNLDKCKQTLDLQIAKLWEITNQQQVSDNESAHGYLKDYGDFVRQVVNSSWRRSKFLIYHPSIEGGKKLGETLPYDVSYLNSKENDTSCQIIITTSVADAGITIPNVDVVISPVVDTFVLGGKPELAIVSRETLLQRRGRTGRTNNGNFWVLYAPKLKADLMTNLVKSPKFVVPSLMSAGVSMKWFDTFDNQTLLEYLSDMGLSSVEFEKWIDTYDKLADNLQYWREMHINADLAKDAGSEIIFDYTAAGSVSPSTSYSINEVTDDISHLSKILVLQNKMEQDLTSLSTLLRKLSSLTALKKPIDAFIPFEILEHTGSEMEKALWQQLQ